MARVEGRVWWKRKKKGRKSREWATEGRERLRKKGEREKGRGREKRTETERRKKEISSGSGEKERNRKREGQRGEKGGKIERTLSTTIAGWKACRHWGNMRCDRNVYCVSA